MTVTMPSQQRGLGLGGFVIGAFAVVLLSVTGLKLVPAYIENETIKNIFVTIAHDPDMEKASAYELQSAFEKRASVNDIDAIKASDIEISSEDGMPYLSASYAVKVPLVANISFYLEFNPSSAK